MGNKVEIEKRIPLLPERNCYTILDDLQPGDDVAPVAQPSLTEDEENMSDPSRAADDR